MFFDDKDDERFKNLMIFNIFGTNEEIGNAAPIIIVVAILAVIITCIIAC